MAKSLDGVLTKRAHKKEQWTEEKINEMLGCSDASTGYLYFANKFFYIQHPVKGKMLFSPFEYQQGLLHSYHNNRFNINMLPRQSGKTTCASAYLLWYAMFHKDQTILVAAHKYTGAQEIMQRIRYGYELCPDHIRAGVINYNKGSMEFDNGSRIVSATTTGNTGRSMSISLLYCLDGDSTVKIRNKITLVEEDITLQALYGRLYNPMLITMFASNNEYEILTPDGWCNFNGLTEVVDKSTYTVRLISGEVVSATSGHYFFINDKKIKLQDLSVGDYIDTSNGSQQITNITENVKTTVYDIVEVDNEKHQFIVNNCFITKNCDEFAFVQPNIAEEFWTSISPTLATGGRAIITSTPNSDEDTFALIWKESQNKFNEFGDENLDGSGINGFFGFSAEWSEHPDRDDEWRKVEIGRIGEERFRREYGCIVHDSVVTVKWPSGKIEKLTMGDIMRLISV